MQNTSFDYLEKILYSLRGLYDTYGYTRYRMSKFEEYDLYARNKDFLISDGVITFTDTNGKLMALKPEEFEDLISRLFREIGFREVSRTRLSGDGGIDVRGTMVTGGVIRTELAIQAKRWKRNVQAPIVQQVRGSLGAHEQGCIVTTSDFSAGAREEARKMDKAPIALIDGKELINLMLEYEVGVRRKEVPLFEVKANLLDDVEDAR